MATPELLTIVEDDQADRVVCQAEGCGHGVYRRIHVVRCEDGQARVYGSDCFGRLFQGLIPEARPRYGGTGRTPTPAELASVEAEAKAIVREKFDIDNPDAPGWRGLVIQEAKRLLGKS